MRFTVLGPVTVVGSAGPIEIGGYKQRLVLAILLSRARNVVPLPVLVDALWNNPPDDERKRVAWHMTKLRGLLRDPERITWRDDGYVLDAHAGEIDAERFTEAHREGAALADTDPARAADLLREALELWNGTAYGELAEHEPLRDVAARLNMARQAALQTRIDVDLALGRHREVIAELETLVTADPWNQKYRAQLMLALYRSGQQVDALRIYRVGRDLLVSELGIEPGAELRDLERAILREDAALWLSASASAMVPAELPASPPAFTGRDDEAARLAHRLRGGGTSPIVISAVTGSGGVGKSALAIYTGHRVSAEFPDGQLYVNLRGAAIDTEPLRPETALSRLLRSLRVDCPPHLSDVEELAARFRSATADKRLLIILDDARDVAQVRHLLPAGDGCAVVITSRRSLASLDGADRYRLDVLPATEAVALLRQLVGDTRVDREAPAAVRVAEHCGRMPLALCVVAARMNTNPEWTFAALADRLSAESRRLNELDDGDRAVRSTFLVSYRELEPGTARMFRLLGLTTGPDISASVAAAAADVPLQTARRQLETLVAAHLVDDHAPDRFRMHDLSRAFARERADSDEDEPRREQAVVRMLHCYLATARNSLLAHATTGIMRRRAGLRPERPGYGGLSFDGRADAHRWLAAEADNLVAAARQAATMSLAARTAAAALAAALSPQYRVLGRWRESVALGESAVIATADATDSPHRYFALVDLTTIQNDLHDSAEALDNGLTALELSERLDDGHGQLYACKVLGDTYSIRGEFDASVAILRRALRLSRELESSLDESVVLINYGNLRYRMRQYADAVEAYGAALPLLRQHDHLVDCAVATGNTAHALVNLGRCEEAVEWFGRALSIDEEAAQQNTRLESDHYWGLGEARYALGDGDGARRAWRAAARILHRLGYISAEERQTIDSSHRPETPAVHRT